MLEKVRLELFYFDCLELGLARLDEVILNYVITNVNP